VLSERLPARGLKQVGNCLCGVEGFLQVLREEHPSVERVFRDVLIPPLTNAQAEEIIKSALDSVRVGRAEQAKRRIVKLSGNYPEPVHLLGSEAFRLDTDSYIDESDVERAIDVVVRHVRANYLRNVIARANSGRDQDILRAMAELNGDVKTVADVGRRLGLSAQQFGSNMTRLTREGIVHRERKGPYRCDRLRRTRSARRPAGRLRPVGDGGPVDQGESADPRRTRPSARRAGCSGLAVRRRPVRTHAWIGCVPAIGWGSSCCVTIGGCRRRAGV
jgi:hypothetical protein